MNGPVTRNADAKLLVCKAEKDLTSSQQRCRWLWKYLPRLSPVAICTILICENCVEKKEHQQQTTNTVLATPLMASIILLSFLNFWNSKPRKNTWRKSLLLLMLLFLLLLMFTESGKKRNINEKNQKRALCVETIERWVRVCAYTRVWAYVKNRWTHVKVRDDTNTTRTLLSTDLSGFVENQLKSAWFVYNFINSIEHNSLPFSHSLDVKMEIEIIEFYVYIFVGSSPSSSTSHVFRDTLMSYIFRSVEISYFPVSFRSVGA